MSNIKVSEAAKKAGMSVEDTIKKLAEAGVNVSTGDDTIKTDDANTLDSKQSQLDKRQVMLKKALERHKKGVKTTEVVVGKGGPEYPQARKMSKEDLMKKKAELDQRIKKVDEDREVVKERAEQVQTESAPAPKAAAPVDQSTPESKPSVASEPAPKPAVTTTSTPEGAKPTRTENTGTRPNYNNQDRPSGQQRTYNRDDNRDNSDNRQGGYQGNRDNRDSNRTGGGYQGNRDNRDGNRTGGGYQGNRDNRDGNRTGGGYQGNRDNRDGNRTGGGYQGNRDGNRTGGGYQGNREGGNRDGRPPFNKDRNQSGGSRFGTDNGSLTLTQEEERKRIVKKKEDDNKDKDKKAVKPKKDVKKTTKSWAKTINEGMDELNIEKEIEKQPVINPNIDISDLISVDQPRPNQRNNRRGNFDKRNRRKGGGGDKSQQNVFIRPERVEIGERIVLSEFSAMIGVKATELIKKLFGMGLMATVNQSIDADTAQLIGMDYGIEVVMKTITEDDLLPTYVDKDEDLSKRPPIVTVMGHVDHGKTSLLDAIRSTSVASGEAGGITQHIGAYEVESTSGKIIFLDTPGHEAFTTLRARGALLTDIVILVVAADDGVKPQTKEAIDHAKAAGVKIVVAINKMDKEGANPEHVKAQLAEHEIISEEWGGEYQFQEISAKQRTGIDDLLERVLLEAEVLDLKGNARREAEGIVIESRLDKQKGPVATVLVKNGTLKRGDTFISGSQFGKVRAMFNYKGQAVKEGSFMPVEIMGFSEVPEAGEKFIVVEEKTAKQVAELREKIAKEKQQASHGKLSLADLFGKIKEGELKELNIVLKADAQGSLEALSASLLKLTNQEVKVNIIHSAIGAITESDVSLASASKAIMIGFNVRPDNNAKQVADRENIDIELYSVIYKAIDDVKMALEGLLSPEVVEQVVGKVEIRQVFSVPKVGKIAGCYVLEGKINRNSTIRVIRDSIVIYDGKIGTLKRFTDDAKEVVAGYECGLSIDRYQDIKEGDILEVYELTEEKRTLEDVAKAEKAEKAKENN